MTERSVIRSLTIALEGCWRPEKLFARVKIFELVGHFDEAGTHDGSRYTVMAGWIARADRWAELEGKWNTLLRRHRLLYIHAKDLKQGTRQFKDKTVWPWPKRLQLAEEAGRLAQDHALFSLVVLLSNADYDAYYIAGDKKLRKHRGPLDSKYGVCARICMSLLARLTERYFRDDASLTLIFEAGAKNQGAAQTILGDMYRAAPDIAKYLAPAVGYAIKEQSPGVQAADLLAYPVYVLERENMAEIEKFAVGVPEALPKESLSECPLRRRR
jgi:Protein of unknown function (DUF3800)